MEQEQQPAGEVSPVYRLVGAILMRDGAFLLGKRAPARAFYPGVWDVIGGHVEQAETSEDALVRELQEELGITPLAFSEVAIAFEEDAQSEPPVTYEYRLYHVTLWSGEPVTGHQQRLVLL